MRCIFGRIYCHCNGRSDLVIADLPIMFTKHNKTESTAKWLRSTNQQPLERKWRHRSEVSIFVVSNQFLDNFFKVSWSTSNMRTLQSGLANCQSAGLCSQFWASLQPSLQHPLPRWRWFLQRQWPRGKCFSTLQQRCSAAGMALRNIC